MRKRSHKYRKFNRWLRSNWHWGNIITFATLIYTVYQNAENNDDNNKELKRIRIRDSIQTFRENIQTQTFINEYKSQISRNRIDRTNDSLQLELFSSQISLLQKSLLSQNKAFNIQSQSLEIQRLHNEPDIELTIHINPSEIVGEKARVNPIFSVVNHGNISVQSVSASYFIVVVSDKFRDEPNCMLPVLDFNTIFSTLKPGESKELKRSRTIRYLLDFKADSADLAKNSLAEIKQSYILIAKLRYYSKFQKGIQETYSIHELLPQYKSNESKVDFVVGQLKVKNIANLKRCIEYNKFDYSKLVDALSKQFDGYYRPSIEF